jgi:hypothetical protein
MLIGFGFLAFMMAVRNRLGLGVPRAS